MATSTVWDALLVSVEVSESGWHIRVGVGIVLWAALVLSWLLDGDEDDRTKAAG